MHSVARLASSQKNFTIRVWGDLTLGEEIELKTEKGLLKLDSLVWLIEEKMCIFLGWERDEPLLPMESRNTVRFDHPIVSPKDWGGSLFLRCNKILDTKMPMECRRFFITLDFDL